MNILYGCIHLIYIINDIVEITDNNVAQFAKDFFTINSEYIYGSIDKIFKTFNSTKGHIIENNKIVVHNDETVKRLVYVLRLSIQRSVDSVKNYYQRTVIRNYYVDITDFDKYSDQVILFGERIC